ncbi:MAG: putative Fe-S cluster assembly protein SufT [Gammaproteobacteria bacterium]|nr:putative Fe-S cluster assembly protein SufT [Gammaproteobacteria bacterium]|tara:strand:+ start:298 stop:822 length:525 start_codon:yes stop_codon:yes gene_type:complete
MEQRIISTQRDCPARLVPTGDPINIPAGTFVTLTQTLGGNYTVIMNGNMARVDCADADALGFEPELLQFDPPADGQVNPGQVQQALESVYDPEIPVNIVDLGLVYTCEVEDSRVAIEMTLTAPGCGMGPVLVHDVESRVASVPFVTDVAVELVFDPPWSRDMMSEEAQLELGLF